jgi:hypothetical protein
MKTLSTALFALLFLCFSSCQIETEPVTEGGSVFSKSFVNYFIKTTSIAGDYYNDCQAIRIVAKGDVVSNQKSAEFIELIDHFGDNAYNRRRMTHPYPAIANEFDAIEITSNKDFSEDLSAGASLAGVLKLLAISPAKYIKSKYTEPFKWAENEPEEFKGLSFNNDRGYYPVFKTVSELTAEDMLLINPDLFFLRFTEIPSINKEHTFIITLKYGGKSLSTNVDVVFE